VLRKSFTSVNEAPTETPMVFVMLSVCVLASFQVQINDLGLGMDLQPAVTETVASPDEA
jgi:hypothetical protein